MDASYVVDGALDISHRHLHGDYGDLWHMIHERLEEIGHHVQIIKVNHM